MPYQIVTLHKEALPKCAVQEGRLGIKQSSNPNINVLTAVTALDVGGGQVSTV